MVKTSMIQKWNIPEIGVKETDREVLFFKSGTIVSPIHAQMFS